MGLLCKLIQLIVSSCECSITLRNVSSQPIEMLEISVESVLEEVHIRQMIEWDDNLVKSRLPVLPGAASTFTLHLHGVADFIAPFRPDGTYLFMCSRIFHQCFNFRFQVLLPKTGMSWVRKVGKNARNVGRHPQTPKFKTANALRASIHKR